ncbi:MAG: aminotransferase class III-fold pyridoxal phosphate-dependent enzyme [Flavobacteriaceae bacterium]|nr:aminotransferase class III-fold pyridoxal phosphate-dependent enzyme [Flavobacteriaceae bacterium]
MMSYQAINITTSQAVLICAEQFNIKGKATRLPGELDFNFKIKTAEGTTYILKISRPEEAVDYLEFQQHLLQHVAKESPEITAPKVILDRDRQAISSFVDAYGKERKVRLLTWIYGRVWSQVNPQTAMLRYSLGEQCGLLSKALRNFEHPLDTRNFDWDVKQASWTLDHLHVFSQDERDVVEFFHDLFAQQEPLFENLRHQVVHNDANDNNVIVSLDLEHPRVIAAIDYGDAIRTALINDVAICCAYAIMGHENPLEAALSIVKGYHSTFALEEKELDVLYTAIAMRLVISVTKSAINKQQEPDNSYLLISEKPAWDVLVKWKAIQQKMATYHFRETCNFTAHPLERAFKKWGENQQVYLDDLFPSIAKKEVFSVDLGLESELVGASFDFENVQLFHYKMEQLQEKNPSKIVAGGYLEIRPVYTTDAYKQLSNQGIEYRTCHLGMDFWLAAGTPVHTLFDGEVVISTVQPEAKSYGGLLLIKHETKALVFYSIFGHLSKKSISNLPVGTKVSKGDLIGNIGDRSENGHWSPHLHFQLTLDILSFSNDFPGVASPRTLNVWKSICPDPNLLFKLNSLAPQPSISNATILNDRQQYLGKSLSLQYKIPLKMVRGDGAYLIDQQGQKYLDTVNNVAHVGHEHPVVVQAGQLQMGLLNTNSRYLHENINQLAKEIIATMPPELKVIHFVNSGSEANELAIRMTKAATGATDFIASEVGYHGNSNACIAISSYKFDGKGGSGAPEHTHIFPLPDAFRGKYTGEATGSLYAAEVQLLIDEVHAKSRKVAALIVEPIISCGGQIPLPIGFLEQAYSKIRKAGGLCISDEVQVGCGRLGSTFWGFQLYDVVPDIVTIGKPLGNGHPLAAVVCTQEVAEKFANGMEYFNTFGGNPVSCAIGAAVLQTIKSQKLQENALEVGTYLKKQLKTLALEYPLIADVRGEGLFLGVELLDATGKPCADKADYLVNRMKDFKVLMSTDGPDNNVIKIKPPLVFTRENAKEVLTYLAVILAEDFMK